MRTVDNMLADHMARLNRRQRHALAERVAWVLAALAVAVGLMLIGRYI
ncbi:hypothetical protein [Geminisphaera colitermitum]|nr:hypothetical protein [Geminisphaera colitermitum]